MRPIVALLLKALSAVLPRASAQITSNVLRRVLMLRLAGSESFGTGFTLEADGRQYLITAKHVVAGMKAEGTVEIRQGDGWSPVPVRVFRCDDPVDIAVLVAPKQLTVAFPLEPNMAEIMHGQDVYSLRPIHERPEREWRFSACLY